MYLHRDIATGVVSLTLVTIMSEFSDSFDKDPSSDTQDTVVRVALYIHLHIQSSNLECIDFDTPRDNLHKEVYSVQLDCTNSYAIGVCLM